jgi:hypothetical protein
MAIEIVDLPIENGGSFHSDVSLPEGTLGQFFFKGEDQGFFCSEQVAFPQLCKRLQEGI